MADLVLIADDKTHLSATNTRAAFEGLGHTVALYNASELLSIDFSLYDVIVTVRCAPGAELGTELANQLANGKPLLTTGMYAGLGAGTGVSGTMPNVLNLTGTIHIVADTAGHSEIDITDNLHPITTGFALGRFQITTGSNWYSLTDMDEPYVGDALALGDPDGSFHSTQKTLIAITKGTLDLVGNPINARVVVYFGLYAGQTDYTADGKTLLGNIINWCMASYLISGTVLENGNPISRTVRAYKRSTGKLMGETISSALDGTFVIDVPSSEECYVIVLDDVGATPDYNALIYDRVIPV